MPSINVIIADDHPVVRTGVREILEDAEDINVVGEASTGTEALTEVHAKHPDVLLLDIEMPEYSGVEVARRLRTSTSATHLLALSSYDDQAYVQGLLENGASGYLTKENAPDLIVEAVRAVAAGGIRWFVTPDEEEVGPKDLTRREQTVLIRAAEGLSNDEIAQTLEVTKSTVRSHLANICRKLGVESTREAIVWAWKRSLLECFGETNTSD